MPFLSNAQDPVVVKKVVSINVDGVKAEMPLYGMLSGEIVATYDDGSTETIDASKASYVSPIYLGSKDIEISYKDAKATKKVNVVADPEISSLYSLNVPGELPVGADLSKYSFSFAVSYKGGNYRTVYCPLNELKLIGFDANKLGKSKAFMIFDEQLKPFAVDVYRVPESLDLSNLPTTVEQFTRELSQDIKVVAKYSDGKTEEITLKDCKVSFKSVYVGDVDATVTYHDTKATKTIKVTECPGKPAIINGYYQIANVDNLYWFAKYSSYDYSLNAELTADIVVNENVLTADGKLDQKRVGSFREWIPISMSWGEFKGNGHVIKGLYLVSYNASFFNNAPEKLSGLGLEDFYFESTSLPVNSFASYISEMTNCYAIGYLKGNPAIGLCYNSDNIKDCYSYCTFDVNQSYYLWPIVSNNKFTNCLANADLIPSGAYIQKSEYFMSMEKLCDGTLPEGFSDEVWTPGSKSGNTYTFPHLKAFSNSAYSVTLGDYVVTPPTRTNYYIDESIDLRGAEYGRSFRGGMLNKEAVAETDVTGFSTAKTGTFTATITHKGVSTEFTYTVSEATKIYSFAKSVAQNTPLENIGITLIDKNNILASSNFKFAKVTGFDVTKIGGQEVTVQIGGLTKTQTIQVYDPSKKAKSIDLSGVNKEAYQFGTKLSGTVKITFEDGSEEVVDMDVYNFNQFNVLGEQTLPITLYGLTEELKFNVVKNPNEPKIIDGVYQISNADELIWWFRSVYDYSSGNYLNKTDAALIADIEINKNVLNADGTLNEELKESFSPWTNAYRIYSTFDGQGHTISGIFSYDKQGGFVMENHGTIKNLGIKDSYFFGSGNACYLGSFCGMNYGRIINCWSTATIDNLYHFDSETDHHNCGGICCYNDGVIVNCHYAGLVKFDMGEECGAICCRNSSGVVANSYYLASQSGANEYAKTADEFADGTVLNLLKNGVAEIADGDIWRQKIGVDKVPSFTEGSSNNQTPVTAVAKESDIKVWSFNRTIYIENAPADTKYEIVDLNGRIITTSKTKSTKEEIKINNTGVLIVKIGNIIYKVLI